VTRWKIESDFTGSGRDAFDRIRYKQLVVNRPILLSFFISTYSSYTLFSFVPVKEASVIIAISSPHRVDAMEATQHCISQLKARVPIWKKEIYNDGSSQWMENKECSWNERNSKRKEAT